MLCPEGVRKVGIIGGGVAGVATARVLIAEGIDCVIFEKTSKLGGVWTSNYDGFGIQVPASLYAFPDEPLDGDDYAKGEVVEGYVVRYAKKHGVTDVVEYETTIVAMAHDGKTWILTTSTRAKRGGFDAVVVATGVYSTPNAFMPAVPGRDKFQGSWVHSVDFTEARICSGKRVVVVGYGKSAMDCAQVAHHVGAASTSLVFRDTHWPVPRKILGLVPFEYATFNRVGAGVLSPPYASPGPIESTVAKIPGFLSAYWKLVSFAFSKQFGLGSLEPKLPLANDIWCGHGVLPDEEFFKLVNNGAIDTIRGIISDIKDARTLCITKPDGTTTELEADIVVFGTGFAQDLSFLPANLISKKQDDGLWLFRNIVHPDVPTCFFVGSQATTFMNICTSSLQARWVATALKQNGLPATDEVMRADIAEKMAWKRSTMPEAGANRSSMLQLHQVHYHDELLKDMGVPIRRKASALAEVFDPYRPDDYGSVIAGTVARETKDQPSFLKELALFNAACVVAIAIAIFAMKD
ncbi:hypothetical protein CTAYLR_006113 [Chrysophaeum taylorii]|uniref:Flavin-containing monooxygenase n=1 Tax=Chrysophaeum taylorii TaxID=2483200 RepID=A0AAD7U9P7_9STRA|nr:hypothetical protein CTAYLR_006113 [Chrysophaeum taylorii]